MVSEQLRTILIVEDERIVAMDLQQTLQELGYDVPAIASSADDALHRAAERRPDLVLMDIRINGPRDGIETAALLKAQFDVPVVYLTAHADDGTLERAKHTEPHGYLLKPVKAAELRSVLEVSLHKHRIEVRLRERERWFATTLHSIADAVVAVDLDGNVTFMNTAAEALVGISAADATGTPVEQVLHLRRPPGAAPESPMLMALRSGTVVQLTEDTLVNLTNGAEFVIADSAAPVVDHQRNRRLGAVMVFRDVTGAHELRQQLERADRLASLGTMAAGLAHEVNNPLTVIIGNSEFMDEELMDLRADARDLGVAGAATDQRFAAVADALHDLQTAAGRIDRIVSDIRAFARPAPPSRGQIDVVRCVEWALRTTSHEFRTRARLLLDLRPMPPVEGDEAKLGQVVINLLMNAAQAIPAGASDRHEVAVTTRLEGDEVVIEVRDTGMGIPPEVIGRVFEPFFTTKPVGEGTGLGLSISHGIVRAIGGDLQIDSRTGGGTTVRVRVPAAVARPAVPVVPAAGERIEAGAARARVLLVDDEPALLGVFKRVLKAHEVWCVESARAALALVDAGHDFDVIVSDLLMPDVTGMGLHAALMERRPAQAHRMVFLSGGAFTTQAEDFLHAVPNPRLNKPIEGRRLVQAIGEVLEREGRLPPRPV